MSINLKLIIAIMQWSKLATVNTVAGDTKAPVSLFDAAKNEWENILVVWTYPFHT